MSRDYSQPFWLDRPVGNNAFAFARRGPTPRLWVPALIEGALGDVHPGEHVVFEDVDEHDVLQSCRGLASFVRTTLAGVPAVIVDNHNHVFYFWHEALERGVLRRGATLVHVDQHRDMRIPERPYEGRSLDDASDYTNFHLNVGNFIVPAQQSGLVGHTQFVTGGDALNDLTHSETPNKILDIDLDFFAPEMSYIDFNLARRFIHAHLPTTSLITVATSPFFIDQRIAIDTLRRLF